MDRRTFLRAGLGAAAGLVIGGACGGDGGDGAGNAGNRTAPGTRPVLHLPGGDVGFPSPFAYSPPGFNDVTFVYDSLLWNDPDQKIVPWLASRYDRSPDGLLYTFELREGVRWHDGKPLTAEDVAFSFDYFNKMRPKLQAFLLVNPESVAAARATGERTVEIRLHRPAVTFERAVAARFPIYPKHVWSGVAAPGEAQDREVLVGTGPYKLASYSRGQGAYRYVANDDYFLGKPFVQRLDFVPVADALNALLTGDVDAAGMGWTGVSTDALRPFRRNDGFAIREGRADPLASLQWNLAKGGALADVRFRRACAVAIDRGELVRRVLAGYGAPGNPGFLPPRHPFRVDVEQYRHDEEEANRLFDEAGYRRPAGRGSRTTPDGKLLRFKLLSTPELSAVTELTVAMLKKVGVELEIDPVGPLEGFGPLTAGEYEAAIIPYAGVQGDPDRMRLVYSSRVEPQFWRAHGYADAEFDDLADRQVEAFDEAERKRLVGRMQEIVARDVPILHLYYSRPLIIYRPAVFDEIDTSFNKQVLITGRRDGDLTARRTAGAR